MANIYLTPSFLETQRSKGIMNNVLADFIGKNVPEVMSEVQAVRQKYGKDNDAAVKSYLDWKIYGTTNPTERFSPPASEPEQEPGLLSTVGSYLRAPSAAFAGAAVKGIGKLTGMDVSGNQDVQNLDENLQKSGTVARYGLPVVAGLATGGLGLLPAAGITGTAGAVGRGINETTDAVTGVDQQSIGGRVKESLTEGVVTGVVDATVGKGLKVAGKVGKKLLSPFASRFDSEIAALASRKGLDLPVSSLSKSNVVKQLETYAQKGIAGGAVEEQVETATKKLSSMADDLVKSFQGSDDFTVAGKSVIEGANTFRDAWRVAKNKAYDVAKQTLRASDSGGFQPDTRNTVAVIDEIMGGKQAASGILGDTATSDALSGILQSIRTNLTSGKTLPLEAFTSTLDELNQMTKFGNTLVSTGDQAVLKKVIATLDGDVARGLQSIAPKAAQALDKADALYSKGIRLLDSDFGNRIAKLSDNPTKIVDQLITPKSVDDVPRIFELIGKGKDGPQRVADVRAAFTRKLIDSTKGADGVIGNQLAKSIDRFGESTVKAVLGDDAFKALREVQQIASAINTGQSVAKGSQTAFVQKITAFVLAVGSGNIPLAAGIAGGDVGLSKLFSTQWFRSWLTTGLNASPALKAAGQIGGQLLRRGAVAGSQQLTPNE